MKENVINNVLTAFQTIEYKFSLSPFELFGVEIGLGWYGLIFPIVKEIIEYNIKNPNNEIFICEIKDKCGTLQINTG
jgi:hypothetical protein